MTPTMTNKEFAEWMDNEGGLMSLYRHGFDVEELKDKAFRQRMTNVKLVLEFVDRLETDIFGFLE